MSSTPPSTLRGTATKGAVAVGLLILGLACVALFRVLIATEHHSYASGSVARQTWQVTADKRYALAVPGGVDALEKRGVDVSTPQCTYDMSGSTARALTVQAEGSGTKATNVLATFYAPETGRIHVDCLGWGALFIDNADNASTDVASGLLIVGVIALAIGFGLGLSALRSAGGGDGSGAAGEDDEIERLVHLVHVRSQDGEVSGDDGDDVLT